MFVRGCRLMLSVERVTSRDELHDDEPLALRLEDVLEGHDVRVTPHAAEDLHLVAHRLSLGQPSEHLLAVAHPARPRE